MANPTPAADPPHYREAEEAVLGSLLQDCNVVTDVADLLDVDDFYVVNNQIIFRAILDLFDRGSGVDVTIVGDHLQRSGDLERIGGVLELTRLLERVPSAANVMYHARIVLDFAERRRIAKGAQCVATQAASLAVPLEETRQDLARLADGARRRRRDVPTSPTYSPFPVDALPELLRGFVVSSAQAIGCDNAMVALPLLSGLAAAIGNSRRIRLKSTWTEPAIVWTVLVAPSGAIKSPPFESALAPLLSTQDLAMKDHLHAMGNHATELLRHQAALADWRRTKQRAAEPPAAPEEPRAWRIIVVDATTEAIAPILRDNPRGLLLARDELSGWFEGFDAYRNGRGGDVAHWLEWFRGAPSTVDRKTGERIIHIPRASLSVTGTVQPEVLRRALGMKHFANGLAARLLVAMPPPKLRTWSEATVAPGVEAKLGMIFGHLLALLAADGEPVLVDLSPAGKSAWVAWFNRHGQEQAALTGDLAAAWSKLEGYCARFALILHLAREAVGDATAASTIDENDIASSVQLVEWFGHEAERVYAMLRESSHEREIRELVELIGRRGRRTTARDLQHASGRFKSADDAARALQRLVTAGRGHWVEVPTGEHGGRPTRAFQLHAETGGVDTTDTTAGERRDAEVLSVSSTPSPLPDAVDPNDETTDADDEPLPWDDPEDGNSCGVDADVGDGT